MQHDEICKETEIVISENESTRVCELFKVLGEESRLKIVCSLIGTSMCVAHLAEHVGMEQSALSHQLRNLKIAGLVNGEKKGKQVFYSLDDDHVYAIISQAMEHIRHKGGI
ncbi:MAG: ArsR/SmtB family transcription factor [Christensenellaceae bacterium]